MTPSPKIWLTLLILVTWPLAFVIGKKTQNHSPQPSSTSPTKSKTTSSRPSSPFQNLPETAAARTLSLTETIQSLRTQADFQATIADLIKFSDKTEKERHLALLFEHWLNINPNEALLEVRKVEILRTHGRRIALSFENWAAKNPAAASQLLTEALSPKTSDLSTLAFRDKIDPPTFILSLFSSLANTDPKAAASVLNSAPESAIRRQTLSTLAQTWFNQDSAQALQWASHTPLSNPGLRQQALSEVATRSGLSPDPQTGIDWANTLTNVDERTLTLKNISTQWSQRSAASAFQWASSLPDRDPSKFEVMPQVIHRLTITNPGLAADWLNQYEAAPRMDASIAAYARTIKAINPTAAAGSAQAITDPLLRAQVEAELNSDQK